MFDPESIIKTAGLIGIYLVVFAESGLLVGFFLPGDTLLFSAGIFASQGFFSLTALIVGTSIFAIIGDSVGYYFGNKFGKKKFSQKSLLYLDQSKITQAENFYKKYGPLSIVLARFIPVVRTLVPFLAGVASMKYKIFFIYNVFGGILWASMLSLLGYYLGSKINNPDRFIFPILIFVIVASFVPFVISLIKKSLKK